MAKSKKSLDKDIMFSKIMPSSMRREDTQEIPAVHEAYDEQPAAAPAPDDTIGMLKSRLFSRSEEWRNGETASTFNIMEDLVLEHLDLAISKFNCCRCDRCRRDIAALALNFLSPKYAVAEPSHVAELMEEVPVKPIFDALVRAIIKVRAHPRH